MRVTVSAPSRLAFCLLDLNGSHGRVDGCLGLALDNPRTIVHVQRGNAAGVDIQSPVLVDVTAAIESVIGPSESSNVQLVIDSVVPRHIGLGSTTQLLLSVGKGVSLLCGEDLGVREIATRVGRGGTSGVGVACFESGGLVLDGGHAFGPGREKESFVPSSASRAKPPPIIAKLDFPAFWRVVCVRLLDSQGLSGRAETEFFRTHCPTQPEEVAELCWDVFSFLGAVADRDLQSARQLIDDWQTIGFKKAIWEVQPTAVRSTRDLMSSLGLFGIGLSSFGPTMYCIVADTEADAIEAVLNAELLRRNVRAQVWVTSADTDGARVRIEQ